MNRADSSARAFSRVTGSQFRVDVQLLPGSRNPHANVLSSWKEIAAYLGKGVRTVQRWEAELGLPVHRPDPVSRGIVIATKEELAAWLVQQQTRAQAKRQTIPRAEFTRMKALVNDTIARAEALRKSAARLAQEFETSRVGQRFTLDQKRELRDGSHSLLGRLKAAGSQRTPDPEEG